tara:strand:+ start:825 stop:1928 length:1104 start_codon:yes stop_codon:yes gene_type:complete
MNKISYIESIRGVLAMLILLFHAPLDSLITGEFLINAWIAVDIFFVISGYVITLKYFEVESFDNVIMFQKKRLFRLYPLHLITLVIFLFLEIIKYIAKYNFGFSSELEPFSINNSTSFLSNLFLIQVFTGHAISWNLVSWSISAEFWTYIIFILTAFFASQDNKKYLIFSILLILISAIILSIYGFLPINGLARGIYSFFIGSCFLIIFRGKFQNVNLSIPILLIVSLMLTAIFSKGESYAGINFLIPWLAATLLIALDGSNENNLLIRVLNFPLLLYLGKISFSLYILHNIVWWILKIFLVQILQFPLITNSQGEIRVFIENYLISNLLIIFSVGVIIFISHYSYKYIEKPFINMARFQRKIKDVE